MSRALGFHLHGERLDYALVEKRSAAPPEVLAAGRCELEQVVELYRRLAAEHSLPWAIAHERGGECPEWPGPEWPLSRPHGRGRLHPSVAAGIWEWELGRIQPDDLFLWLRAERVFWSCGEPGRGPSGMQARRGPLTVAWKQVRAEAPRGWRQIALAVEGDAPGAGTLERQFGRDAAPYRRVQSQAPERGCDRAAAGAALAALEPERPGILALTRPRSKEPWLWAASIMAAAAVGGAAYLGQDQAEQLESQANSQTDESESPILAGPGSRPAPLPEDLARLLARRDSVQRAFEELPSSIPADSLAELEILSATDSARARVRMRLLPGGQPEGEAQLKDWQPPEIPGLTVERRELDDGSIVVEGEIHPLEDDS